MSGLMHWIRIRPSPWTLELAALTVGSIWTLSAQPGNSSVLRDHRAAI